MEKKHKNKYSVNKKAVSNDMMIQMLGRLRHFLKEYEKKYLEENPSKKKLHGKTIAYKAGFAESHISALLKKRIEGEPKTNKDRDITVDVLLAFKKAFGLSSDYILSGDCPMFVDPGREVESEKKSPRLTNKEQSIHIHYFHSLTMIEQQIIEKWIRMQRVPNISELVDSQSGFIGYPNIIPFSGMAKRQIISFYVDQETGMSPIIESNDIVMVDLGDREIQEKQIYLVYFEGKLKIRYAEQFEIKGNSGIAFKPEENKFKMDRMFLSDIKYHPIIGKVITITRPFITKEDYSNFA